ncbi:MAG: diaminopimelate epimerase [Steroidobacteraceae bacterium]
MRLAFTKMHGLGNDFIVFDAATPAAIPSPAELRRLSDRRTGIGFDQALVLEPSRRAEADVHYRIFNADGSEVEQCGNGARCIARFVASRRHAALDRPLVLDSPGGVVHARLRADGLVSVAMGVPDFAPASLPFTAAAAAAAYRLDTTVGVVELGAVSIGNPHAVIRVPAVASAPVDTVGPAVENHDRFPRRVNVGFLEIVAPDHVRLRVFERGVGETRACGTGACAAVAVGRHHGPLAEEVTVDVPGGRLIVRWPGPGAEIWLTGPAETAFEGFVDLAEQQAAGEHR